MGTARTNAAIDIAEQGSLGECIEIDNVALEQADIGTREKLRIGTEKVTITLRTEDFRKIAQVRLTIVAVRIDRGPPKSDL